MSSLQTREGGQWPTDSHHRRLSETDGRTFHGTLTLANSTANVKGQTWKLLHIPKTAGDSVMLDSPQHLPVGSTFTGNNEKSYAMSNMDNKPDSVVVFIREPTSHVLSQYLECKYSPWGKGQTAATKFPGLAKYLSAQNKTAKDSDHPLFGFDEWIEHFVNYNNSDYDRNKEKKFAYQCYNPWNMQTRYLASMISSRRRRYHPTTQSHFVLHETDRFPDLQVAKQRLSLAPNNSIKVVGITNYYTASMCLLEFQAHNQLYLSPKCQTCDPVTHRLEQAKAKEHHNRHNVPPHNTGMISQTALTMIQQNLTQIDQHLYEYALEIFHQQVRHVRETLGVDLLCGTGPNGSSSSRNAGTLEATQKVIKRPEEGPLVEQQSLASSISLFDPSPLFQPDNKTTFVLLASAMWLVVAVVFMMRSRRRRVVIQN